MDAAKQILNLVRHIQLPKNSSFLGVHPILSMWFQTDDANIIRSRLKATTSTPQADELVHTVKYCVHSSIYPHKSTVWLFNDCSNDVHVLQSYLKRETTDFDDMLTLHSGTYPFIETESNYTDPPIEKSGIPQPKVLPPVRKNPETPNVGTHRTTPSFIVPTVTIGSLYLLSQLAKEKD